MPESEQENPKQPLSVPNIPKGSGKAKKEYQRGLYEDSKKKHVKGKENETSLAGPELVNNFGEMENFKREEMEDNGEEPIDFNGTLGRELQPAEFCSVKKGKKKFNETFDGRQLECEINGKRKKINLPGSTRKIANDTCPANDQHTVMGKVPRKKNLKQIQTDAGSIIEKAKFQRVAEERFFSPGKIPGEDSPEKFT
jgi:hypothetical protein